MQKESYVIESAPVKKEINWKILIIILIILLLLAVIVVLSFSVYDYITTPRNETNLTDTDNTNPIINPSINNTPNNLTNTTGNTINSDNNPLNNTSGCTPNCTGKQCGSDGCGGLCAPGCNAGYECNSTGNCALLINCSVDSNCSYLIGVCGKGLCNQTAKKCYASYNSSSIICRNNVSGCDAVEMCAGNSVSCPDDLNKTNGTVCLRGTCSNGKCVNSCTPNCAGKQCGSDGCGGNCPPGCSSGESCSSAQKCEARVIRLTNNISRNGITWYFDREYEYGTFVNGDYWVLDEGSGVRVINVNPEPSTGRNGNMVNPPLGMQAFHSGVKGYNSSLAVYFPKTIHSGESLVSTISVNSSHNDGTTKAGTVTCACIYDGSGYCVYNDEKSGCYQLAFIYKGAVLTVLNSVPPIDAFRPSYLANQKRIYALSDIENQRKFLLSLEIAGKPDITSHAKIFENVWIDLMNNAPGRLIRPIKNGPTYGEYFSRESGTAALLLNLNYTSEEKERLLINYLQLGVDLYGISKSGGNWDTGGGHDHGRKLPILFAGVMFNDSEMKNVNSQFSEISHSYAGKSSDGNYIPRYGWTNPKCTGTYALQSGGCWGIISSTGAKDCDDPNGLYDTCGYQGNIIYAWVGQAVTMKYLYDSNTGKYLKELFNHDPFFDFIERWMNKDVAPSYTDSATEIAKAVWSKFRYCNADSDCFGHPLGSKCIPSQCYLEDCSGWNKKECAVG